MRVFSIINYENEPYIILNFDHKRKMMQMARWLHPIKLSWIQGIARKLTVEKEIPEADIKNYKVLFSY